MNTNLLVSPPLSLYIHIPWCIEKCPYCDFNSHALKSTIPEQDYVRALITDLDADIARFTLTNRPLHSIFIGGGTPSLFSPNAIESLLNQVLSRFETSEDLEITLEANPGTVEADKFIGFAKAGITRLSIGVQSFESEKLIKLGRIHNVSQAQQAAQMATGAKNFGLRSFNLDLMHGLPNQSIENALDDLKTAISLMPDHLSWYQLTIEPNTAFHSKPPKLPQDETLWNIQEQGFKLLAEAGYQQYEISGFSLAVSDKGKEENNSEQNKQCQHNLNYWRFGDYLGIGCGAHGKISDASTGAIQRTVKVKHPKGYLDPTREPLDYLTTVTPDELPFEFMMNQLRLFSRFTLDDYQQRTGLTANTILPTLQQAKNKKLISCTDDSPAQSEWQVTPLGRRYLNDLLELFL